MKKIAIIVICLLSLGSMLAICPLNLIRREEMFQAGSSMCTDLGIVSSEFMVRQEFQARAKHLHGFSIIFSLAQTEHKMGEVIIELKDTESNIISTWHIPIEELSDRNAYYDISCDLQLKKGKTYTWNIYASENTPSVRYTTTEAEYLPENTALFYNKQEIEGQLGVRYLWDMPLNYKNILCVWSFIAIICLTLLETIKNRNKLPE